MNRRRVLAITFYGLLGGLMALILTDSLDDVVSGRWERRLSYNSEGYLFALGLAAWIQFVRPRATVERLLRWASIASLGCIALGVVLIVTDPPSQIRTLNESMFALALAIPYVSLARPLFRWVPWLSGVLAAAVFVSIAFGVESWAVTQAETIAFVVLTPIAFDVIDRGILDPFGLTSPVVRWTWYTALVSEMVVVSALGTSARSGDSIVAGVLDYLGRIHESIIGVLLVQFYFAVGLGRRGRRAVVDG
jgi:hypothetical protein